MAIEHFFIFALSFMLLQLDPRHSKEINIKWISVVGFSLSALAVLWQLEHTALPVSQLKALFLLSPLLLYPDVAQSKLPTVSLGYLMLNLFHTQFMDTAMLDFSVMVFIFIMCAGLIHVQVHVQRSFAYLVLMLFMFFYTFSSLEVLDLVAFMVLLIPLGLVPNHWLHQNFELYLGRRLWANVIAMIYIPVLILGLGYLSLPTDNAKLPWFVLGMVVVVVSLLPFWVSYTRCLSIQPKLARTSAQNVR
jgi:hypothetical protein